MKVEKLGKVTHGVTISRIEAKSGEDYDEFELFTMQDLSREIDNYSLKEEKQYILVSKNKFNIDLLSKKDMIIIGLTSHKAMVVGEKHIGKIIPSNFAYIQLDNKKIDPMYFTWYFNEHPKIQKQLQIAIQGSIIRALSVQMLRALELWLPSLEEQQKIGKIYELRKRKEKALFEKNVLEKKLYKYLMIKKLKEE
ncbi:restriction endonuclease subunit S [Tepidibacter mesophilus]|uniref:restriction endonuclease subunit S n=1 Tax=Tepidibacter mesophilus TaxID=655607 RepID=UPI000C07F70F|nr:restriction endonuclease subunit S [Tepidibacter mesophilus]